MKNIFDWAELGSKGLAEKYADGDEGIRDILDILRTYDGSKVNSLLIKVTKDNDAINALRILNDPSTLKESGLDEVFELLKATEMSCDSNLNNKIAALRPKR